MLSSSCCASSGERIGVLPRLTSAWAPAPRRRDCPDHLADHEPVEQHAHRRQMLLDPGRCVRASPAARRRRRRARARARAREAPGLAPAKKLGNGLSIGGPCVAVADVGGEEFEKTAPRVLAGGGDLGRDQGVGFRDEELIIHETV